MRRAPLSLDERKARRAEQNRNAGLRFRAKMDETKKEEERHRKRKAYHADRARILALKEVAQLIALIESEKNAVIEEKDAKIERLIEDQHRTRAMLAALDRAMQDQDRLQMALAEELKSAGTTVESLRLSKMLLESRVRALERKIDELTRTVRDANFAQTQAEGALLAVQQENAELREKYRTVVRERDLALAICARQEEQIYRQDAQIRYLLRELEDVRGRLGATALNLRSLQLSSSRVLDYEKLKVRREKERPYDDHL